MSKRKYLFEVETKEAGQRASYGDSYYHFIITSDIPEWEVKQFCTKMLKPSYPKAEMPNAFSGELLEFKKLTDNNVNNPPQKNDPEDYSYKVRTEYTG